MSDRVSLRKTRLGKFCRHEKINPFFPHEESLAAELNPNAIMGLGSQLNTREIIGRFVDIEKRKAVPIQKRKDEKVTQLQSWDVVKTELKKLHEVIKDLRKFDVWESKEVESSDPSVIFPTATQRAKVGKTKIIVDKLALSHQISSQGFASPDESVGVGKIKLQVGDPEKNPEETIMISRNNNTLEGIRSAINSESKNVEAFVIKTGSSEKPYQLLLTSKVTGEQGRIDIDINLKNGKVPPPLYQNSYDKEPEWEGEITREINQEEKRWGASTPIVEPAGKYTGDEDIDIQVMVSQGGIVNSESGIILSWKDSKGRSGDIELNQRTYKPGSPVSIVDGVGIVISDGEAQLGDSFDFKAYSERSEWLWWLSDAERSSRIGNISNWRTQGDRGSVHATGLYTADVDQTLVLRAETGGQVGGPKKLFLHYEFTETGETGKVNIGSPYLSEAKSDASLENAIGYDFDDGEGLFKLDFNTFGENAGKIKLPHGVEIQIPPGILHDGDTANIDLFAPVNSEFWWFDDEMRSRDGRIQITQQFEPFDPDRVEPLKVQDGLLDLMRRKSTADIQVTGSYQEDTEKTYIFTMKEDGAVGITRNLTLQWEDNLGNTGSVEVGADYKPGSPLPFDSELSISLGEGMVFEEDYFFVSTKTPTVQQAQDAILRLGASEAGEGLEISRPSNIVNDIIDGVELELLTTSDDRPITVTVKGDYEKAKELLREFVDSYNTLSATVTEFTKYDPGSKVAGPLLSDRNITKMQNEIANTAILAVPELPNSTNMLFSVGLRLDDKGMMSLNDKKLEEKMSESFADVANVFRTKGESDNPRVSYLNITDKTQLMKDGFEVQITQAAQKSAIIGESLEGQPILIDDLNNEIIVIERGRRSNPIEIEKRVYDSVEALARKIQLQLNEDKKLGARKIEVTTEGGALKFVSGAFGKSSSIEVLPNGDKEIESLGLISPTIIPGQDVEGTVDTWKAKGRGQILSGVPDTPIEGLRLFVELTPEELDPLKPEAKILVSKGIASRLDESIKGMLDPAEGRIKSVTKDIQEQVKAYDDQLKRLNQRVDTKRGELQIKFAKLDATLGKLKAQQNYLSQQFASLGGSKGGGGGGKK